jgi:16S rRNA G966 N2-methylase RsmD
MDINIKDFINIRHSTKKLSDNEFEQILPELASQLENVNYVTEYTAEKLKIDWENLCNWTSSDDYINSTSRVGMKLCEQYFHNFYDIENNKGKSFSNLWNKKNLEKILRWNRKSHSTPYLSELKRGIYFCCGMTKSTMFRPQMAKLLCIKYQPKIVLDPCAGWGGRMLGVVASGAEYIAFEPNTKTYNNLVKLSEFLEIKDRVRLICDDALKMNDYLLPKVDMILTSPPYFDLEVYSDLPNDASNQKEYSDFLQILDDAFSNAIKCLKDNRFAVITVGDIRDKQGFYYRFVDDIKDIFKRNNLLLYNELILIQSVGNGALRANRYMGSRKVVKMHEQVLVFYKGNPKEIKNIFPKIEMKYDDETSEN